jgi:anti-anti-sigma factor
MFVQNEKSRHEVELRVQGPLASEAAEEFQKVLQELSAGDYKIISLDLSGVPSINSTCIGKILLLRKSLAEQDRTIRINGCSDALYNTFQLIKFDRLVSIERGNPHP